MSFTKQRKTELSVKIISSITHGKEKLIGKDAVGHKDSRACRLVTITIY